jgi:NADPH:quinone reductase-like Zn-dependent oxidoreductase
VASFVMQFAIAAGALTYVTSSSQTKIDQAIELGARGGFDYRDPDWPTLMKSTAGPPELIVESAGGAGYDRLVKLAAPGGRIVSYGATTGPADTLDLHKVFWKQLTLQGSTMGSPADFAEMVEFVEQHGVCPIVDEVFPLAAGDEAIARMQSSPQFGKYVLDTA